MKSNRIEKDYKNIKNLSSDSRREVRHHTDQNESLFQGDLNEMIKDSNDGLEYSSNKNIKNADNDYSNDGAKIHSSNNKNAKSCMTLKPPCSMNRENNQSSSSNCLSSINNKRSSPTRMKNHSESNSSVYRFKNYKTKLNKIKSVMELPTSTIIKLK